MDDRCVICDEWIPEGWMVCGACEDRILKERKKNMTKCICDKCGKDINGWYGVAMINIRPATGFGNLPDHHYDLCEDCATKLEDWILNPAKPEEGLLNG